MNKVYLVSQSYPRGQAAAEQVNKKSILLSDYDNIGLAKWHYAAIKRDPLAAIINLTSETHLQTVRRIVSVSDKYVAY